METEPIASKGIDSLSAFGVRALQSSQDTIYHDGCRSGLSVTSSSQRTKITNFRCNLRNVRFKTADPPGTGNRERSRKTHKNTPTQAERGHPAIEVSPQSPCGAISLGTRPSYQQNPKNGTRDEETQKFALFACVT